MYKASFLIRKIKQHGFILWLVFVCVAVYLYLNLNFKVDRLKYAEIGEAKNLLTILPEEFFSAPFDGGIEVRRTMWNHSFEILGNPKPVDDLVVWGKEYLQDDNATKDNLELFLCTDYGGLYYFRDKIFTNLNNTRMIQKSRLEISNRENKKELIITLLPYP